MSDFIFTSPDGVKYKVSGPDGATQEQAWAILQQQIRPQEESLDKQVGAALGGFVGGLPVVGPALKTGAEYTAAGAKSLITGRPFSEELQHAKERVEGAEKAYPGTQTLGEVAGGITGMAAAGAAAPAAMGLTGTLTQMIGRGAASGAAIGAADAAARGQSPLTGGAIGAGAGVAGPVIGRVAAVPIQRIAQAYHGIVNPAEEAAKRVGTAAVRDAGQGMTPADITAARQAGQPVKPIDVGGETTRALARSAANTSPEGRAILNRAIDQRYEQQAGRITNWLRTNFHFPNAMAQQEALDNLARTTNKANYAKAYQRGDEDLFAISPTLQRLSGAGAVRTAKDAAMKAAHDDLIAGGYNGKVPKIPNLHFWDLVRREVSDMAIRAGHGTNESRRLNLIAKQLNEELDRLVPEYRAARQGAASFFHADNALEAGQKSVSSRMNNREIRQGLSKMSAQERQLFQDGYIDRMIATINEAPSRRDVAEKLVNSPAAVERLQMIVGPQKAKELQTFIRIENIMDFARGAVQGNSTTARQLIEMGLAGGVGGSAVNKYEGIPELSPQGILNMTLMAGAAYGAKGLHQHINENVARQVAQLLVSDNPQQIQRAMTIIANNQRFFSSIKNVDAAIGRVIAGGSVPTLVRKSQPSPQPMPYGGPQQ